MSSQTVQAHFEKLQKDMDTNLQNCVLLWEMGFISLDEALQEIGNILSVDKDVVVASNSRLNIRGDAQWEQFKQEHLIWAHDGTILEAASPENAWLLFDKEVSMADKADAKEWVFSALRAYHCPICYFRPVPSDMEVPKHHWKTYGTYSAFSLAFDCLDDGGLLSATDPVGKNYSLRATNGLKAFVRITKGKHTKPEMFGWITICGSGWIEGYTSSQEREITITVDPSDTYITSLKYDTDGCGCLYDADRVAFETFERWQPYFKWIKAFETNYRSERRKLLEEYLEGIGLKNKISVDVLFERHLI